MSVKMATSTSPRKWDALPATVPLLDPEALSVIRSVLQWKMVAINKYPDYNQLQIVASSPPTICILCIYNTFMKVIQTCTLLT